MGKPYAISCCSVPQPAAADFDFTPGENLAKAGQLKPEKD
jgi:hypothetical protein